MNRTHKTNPDIREAFSCSEDELFLKLITQLFTRNGFKSPPAHVKWPQHKRGQDESGCPFCSVTSDRCSSPKQGDVKLLHTHDDLGETNDKLRSVREEMQSSTFFSILVNYSPSAC